MEGKELIQTICSHMGKEPAFKLELENLIAKSGISIDQINLEQLRELVANLLHDVILDQCDTNTPIYSSK